MGDTPNLSLTRAVYSPDELLQEDLAILDRYFNYGMIQIRRLRDMRKYGLVDEATLNKMLRNLDWHLGNEVGVRWWTHARKNMDPELAEVIDEILEQGDPEVNRKYLDIMLPPKK